MKKKTSTKSGNISVDMRPEYDFTDGVRGKHYQALQEGYMIRIRQVDGTIIEKSVGGKDTVTLAPDVREYFPTSKDVNHALRTLISIVPQKRKRTPQAARDSKSRRGMIAKSRTKKHVSQALLKIMGRANNGRHRTRLSPPLIKPDSR